MAAKHMHYKSPTLKPTIERARGRVLTPEGERMKYRWRYPVTAGYVQDGHERADVLDWLRTVLHSSEGWLRAGLFCEVVEDMQDAVCVIRYVYGRKLPAPHIGVFQPGAGPRGRDLVRINRDRMQEPYRAVLYHEVGGHAALGAVDMYKGAAHEGYRGIMGNGDGTISDNDIASARDHLRGLSARTMDGHYA